MSGGQRDFANTDYVEVAERVSKFFEAYPNGSIQNSEARLVHAGDKVFVAVTATAYRTPDDDRPGVAQAWEPFPGTTPYTRNSEAMNAETSAVGRALAMLGIATKRSIATRDEINRREQDRAAEGPSRQIQRNQASTAAKPDNDVIVALVVRADTATTPDDLRTIWNEAGEMGALDLSFTTNLGEFPSLRDYLMGRINEIQTTKAVSA
jgi:hypothetical protein